VKATPLLGLLLIGVVSACTTAGSSSPPHAVPARPTSAAPPSSPAEDAFVRTCRSSVYGTLGDGWRRDSVVIGPLAFVGMRLLATAPRKTFDRPVKVLAVVRAGPAVTVQVTTHEPGAAALLYDPANDNTARDVDGGEEVVRFVPCKPGGSPFERFGASGRTTQFNGGFIVTGPQCVALDVTVRDTASIRRWVSFGAGSRCL
jgi:hypothetical protein